MGIQSSSLPSKKCKMTHRLHSTTFYTYSICYSFSKQQLTWSGLLGLLYGLAVGGHLREG